ncbi:MAG: chorismate synthase [Crocinitomicaceae bacterium]|jgi:chorismate synthase|tara:strand:+ start:11603 stop:12670 length:1068 start_codon:yes stop_codon:yes gene_type:complete
MAGSSFGTLFKLSTFGESHGVSMGGIIDGCPSGISLDIAQIQADLNKRKPGQNNLVSERKESDEIQILSGLFEGKTTGTPIGFTIQNKDHLSADYSHLKEAYRPSHADFTYEKKYGIRDYRGGGRSSARETVCRVVAGSIAKQILNKLGVQFSTYVKQIGGIELSSNVFFKQDAIEASLLRCPDPSISEQMESAILECKAEGDTLGGIIQCVIVGVPAGLGEPVFDKLHADLGKAMLSINAVKGFEYGSGFSSVKMKGSEHNDSFESSGATKTNFSGGVQGGISNGMPIVFRVAFKPVATLMKSQETINNKGEEILLEGKGRHDVCVVPRAVPIVEAMAALTILDHYLRQKANQL